MLKNGRNIFIRNDRKKIIGKMFAQYQTSLRLLAQWKASKNGKPFFRLPLYFINGDLKIIQLHLT